MTERRFETAAVIGTGMMGPGIALTLAMGGVRTTVVGRTAVSAVAGMDRARASGRVLVASGLVDPEQMDRAFELVTASPDFDGSVDLVIESAPENMEFKQALFAKLDAETKPDTVLASNTSGLSITAIASKCARPERVLTTHFWNPPHLMPLVEIVKGERTSDEAVERVRALLAACGKMPVVVKKDRPGQLGNRLQMALVREAVNIVQEGIADAEAVDLVAKNGFGIRMPAYGIFEHQDIVGLDMGVAIVDYVTQDLNNEPRAPEMMRELVREGKLGAKTGRGFYDWSSKSADEVRAKRDAFLVEVLRYRKSVAP
jgi:3-hydroxybutyryl-CoA dehydrogenase